ncbi:MAG: acetyl-CoA decarbonylase/synthase complex subunit gamma [Archaeoglobi archaeon]|nr:acetyl-CoA decarbonylase/synthase complex subunit gamma [Candidatus Mnemosynella sp.]
MARKSPLEVYKMLPGDNCGECGEDTCMAFASKLIDREAKIDDCPRIRGKKREKLVEYLTPAVREVKIGERVIGGEEVVYRHELTYFNPTAYFISLSDDESILEERAEEIKNFSIERFKTELRFDGIALRNRSNDPEIFRDATEKLMKIGMPLILCSFNPESIERALEVSSKARPLIYGATDENLEEMCAIASSYDCPLAVISPDLRKLWELSFIAKESGVSSIVLDPVTDPLDLRGTLNRIVEIRHKAIEERADPFRWPILGVPASAWLVDGNGHWEEAVIASVLQNRFVDAMILKTTEMWSILPLLTLRQNIYTDPRFPARVEPGVREIGSPDESSPVLLTTNFALTYYAVEGDVEGKLNCYIIVADTEGLAVEPSIAGGKLKASDVADIIKESGLESKVKHRKMIIPGAAARIRGDLEDATGWEILVGPKDSSGIVDFVSKHWKV